VRERERKSERYQAPFSPSVASLCHPGFTTTKLSYRFPIFETSATALCGTAGTNKFPSHGGLLLVGGSKTHHHPANPGKDP